MLDESERLRSGDSEFPHVADIEKAGSCANCGVFLRNAAVFHRHMPAAEGNHPRAEIEVCLKKSGALEVDHE